MRRLFRYSFGVALVSITFCFFGGVPVAHADCPERYTGSIIPPSGYGAAYNVFDPARSLLLQVNCDAAGDATITLDSDDKTDKIVIYKNGFRWTGGSWKAITFTGTPAAGTSNGNWLELGAQTTVPNAELRTGNQYTYFAAYSCIFANNKWNCGCRDTYCVFNGWQLQAIRNPLTSGGTGGGSTGGGGTGGGGTGGGNVGPWKMYDNITFTGQPNILQCGFSPMKFITNNMLGSTGTTVFEQSKIDSYASEIANGNFDIVVLNYENWRTGPGKSLSQNDADRMATVINTLRSAVRAKGNTHAKFSFYGAPFLTRAITAQTGPARTVVDAQDFLAPSLYVTNASEESNNSLFATRATNMINTYRSFGPGKSIVPYIWPQFYGGDLHFLSQTFWDYQLQTLYTKADSVLVWGTLTSLSGGSTRQPWDKTRGWWAASKNFASTKLGVSLANCQD